MPVALLLLKMLLLLARSDCPHFQHFSFVCVTNSGKTTDIHIEYAIEYVKATGKISRKILKITVNSIDPGEHALSE